MSLSVTPKGLTNLGNTCYFNSVTQCLLNAPLFGYLLKESNTNNKENRYLIQDPSSDKQIEIELPGCDVTVKSLVDLYFSYIESNRIKSIAPNKLIHSIRQRTGRFPSSVQEDSHELLMSLIDIIRSDEIRRYKAAIKKYLGEEKLSEFSNHIFTVIDMLFGGYFLSSVKCQKCKHKSQHLEPFYDLSLAINAQICDVSDAIANFSETAILDGDNKVICERCSKVNGEKTYEASEKSTTIAVPPVILTLHLKRFETLGMIEGNRRKVKLSGGRKARNKSDLNHSSYNRKGRRAKNNDRNSGEDGNVLFARGGVDFRKINKHIEFSEFLNLADHTDELCYELTKINNWSRMYRDDPIWYSLFGVVCHSGSLRSGHYTSYVKYSEETHDQDDNKLEQIAHFIRETPYVPGSCDISKIKENIRRFDAMQPYLSEDKRNADIDDDSNDELPRSSPGSWYYISDSDVQKTNLSNVLKSQAYLLFYQRIDLPKHVLNNYN